MYRKFRGLLHHMRQALLLPQDRHSLRHNKPLEEATNLKNSPLLGDIPIGENYYAYYFEEDTIVCIMIYRDEGLWEEAYFSKLKNEITLHIFNYFSSGLAMESFTRYALENNYVISSENYKYSMIGTHTYHYNEDMRLESSLETSHMIDKKFISSGVFRRIYEYDSDFKLFKITRFLDEYKQNIVEYCQDNSFIQENIHEMVNALTKSIVDSITTDDLQSVDALVLPLQKDLMFTFYSFDLLSKIDNDVHWTPITPNYELEGLENLTMNYYSYVGESFIPNGESQSYIKKTISLLSEAIQKNIKNNFNKNIEVLFRDEFESTEKINRYLMSK